MTEQPTNILTCQVCGTTIDEQDDLTNIVACALCGAPHHCDCWDYTGMCSTYGCGGIVSKEFEPNAVTSLVTIDEKTSLPSGIHVHFLSLWRKTKVVIERSFQTVRAGALGGLLVALGYYLLYGYRSSFWRVFPSICGGLTMAVLVYGIISALMASIYHRFSLETSIFSCATFYFSFSIMDLATGHWSSFLPLATIAAVSAMVFASATAESIFGRYTHLGKTLGRNSSYLRYFVTFLAFISLTSLCTWSIGMLHMRGPIQEILMWSLLTTVMGGRSVEVGKEEYRKKLIAELTETDCLEEKIPHQAE